MEEKVKQRLIGVIVIIGALFIILPFLFHNPRPSAETRLSANIAAASAVSVTLPPASTTATTTTTQPADQTPATATTDTATTTDAAATTTQPVDQTPDAATTTQSTDQAPADQTTDTTATTTQPTDQTVTDAAAATQPAATATPSSSSNATSNAANTAFSAPPSALTSGQANEGPVKPVAAKTTPAIVKTPVVVKQEARAAHKRVPMNASTHAWEIQVAVFSSKANANHLIAKLRGQDYQAYSRRVVVNNRALVAVFVGPEINANKAELIKQRLQHTFQLNGEVKKYQA